MKPSAASAGPAAELLGLSFEAGAEASYNTLDYHLAFSLTDENGEHVPIPLPIEDATVKEKRGEVYVSVGKNLSPAMRIDGGVNYEFSDLQVRGDATADRTLKFLKPNLTVDWKPGGGWHTQASIRRTVAQLDFYDFMSAANLSTNQVSGGNENLQPQRSWEFRADGRPSVVRRRLVQARSGARPRQHASGPNPDLRPDAPERREPCFDAPGNLGAGKRYFASLTVDAPLDKLWSGLRVKFTGTYQKTRVEDPIDHQHAPVEQFLAGLAVGPQRPPRPRAIFLRLRIERQPALDDLSHRRVRHELQRRRLWDGVRRIPAVAAHLDHLERRQCAQHHGEFEPPDLARTASLPRR